MTNRILPLHIETRLALLFIAIVLAPATAQISLVGHLEPSTTTNYGDVWGDGNYAYLGTRHDEGVFIIDISDPTTPVVASQYFPSGGRSPQDIKVQDGIGYFAMDKDGGVDIVDLSDPTQPTFLSNIVCCRGVHNVFIDNGLLYTNRGGIWDMSNPAEPQRWHSFQGGHDITVLDQRLYVSSFSEGTRIYDLAGMNESQPPELIATIPTGSNSHSNWTTNNGDVLVNAREINNGDVGVFDISDLDGSPQLLSRIFDDDFGPNASSPHNPLIVGDHLYVSWYESGMQVFDISDGTNPIHLGRFNTSNNWGVYPFLGPDRVLISDMGSGLHIVDVTDVLQSPQSDFNEDGSFDVDDADLLVAAIATGAADATFDLTTDGVVDDDDLDAWLRVAGAANLERDVAFRAQRYQPGDANLDGFVDGEDFIIWNNNKFQAAAAWSQADFDANGTVDQGDFAIWEANKFASAAVSIVPEPAGAWMLGGLLLVVYRRNRHR